MNRTDVEFNAEGTILRGWLYRPDGDGVVPGVAMAHGYSAVKEMYLDAFAEVFAKAGLACLVFDHRNFGASDGEPRYEIDPWEQIRDYRHAITHMQTLPGIDRERIGVWGSSYSGGHCLVLGAIDKRIKCVAAQVPLISGSENARRLIRADMFPGLRAAFDADREARFAGKEPGRIPVVCEDPMGMAVLPTADSWKWFTETANTRAPSWQNEVTMRSVEMFLEYEPGTYISRVSPTPLLLVVAARDHLTVADLTIDAYEQAREPKKLVILPGEHFDAYTGPGFEVSSTAARDWLVQHLTA